MKKAFICCTCGVEYAAAERPPSKCPICEDDRQYVMPGGQRWTTMEEVNQSHKNVLEKEASALYGLYSVPTFAIGQRAHLLITPGGNILWDCITNLDETTIEVVKKFGGLRAICISHPHYFSALETWSRAFGDVPVYVHAADAEWLAYSTPVVRLWEEDEQSLWDGIRLIRLGGHFPGGNVLYWPEKKALLTGDVIQVCPDLKSVSCMYSYPNLIPLPEKDIRWILERTESLAYDSVYGAFGRNILSDGKQAVTASLKRYLSIYS